MKEKIELSEIFHLADSMSNSGLPIESKKHIEEFFEVKNLIHKTRLKRKDIYLLTILEARYYFFKTRYGINIKLLNKICQYIRANLVSESGKGREEFVESIKMRPEYPILPDGMRLGNVGNTMGDKVKGLFQR